MKFTNRKIVLPALLAMIVIPFSGRAEEDSTKGVNIGFGAGLVSSYVWRGNYNAGASIQPTGGLSVNGFFVSVWGSTELAFNRGKNKKEVDYTLAYTVSGFQVAFTDYWWEGEGDSIILITKKAGPRTCSKVRWLIHCL